MKNARIKHLLSNRQNVRFFEEIESYECGLVLNDEIKKKILNYQVSLNGCYGWMRKNELWFRGMGKEDIKLLLNREEIDKIIRITREKGYLLIPESMYIKNYRIKVKMLIAKKQRHTSKRKLETIRRKDEKKVANCY